MVRAGTSILKALRDRTNISLIKVLEQESSSNGKRSQK
jgi:hypothetical protein